MPRVRKRTRKRKQKEPDEPHVWMKCRYRVKRTKTICYGINRLGPNQIVKDAIEETVKVIAEWTHHASLFLDFYARFCFKHGVDPTLPHDDPCTKEKLKRMKDDGKKPPSPKTFNKNRREGLVKAILTSTLTKQKNRPQGKIFPHLFQEAKEAWNTLLENIDVRKPVSPDKLNINNVIQYITQAYESTLWEVFDSEETFVQHVLSKTRRQYPGKSNYDIGNMVEDEMDRLANMIASRDRVNTWKYRMEMLHSMEGDEESKGEESTRWGKSKPFNLVPHFHSYRPFIQIDAKFTQSKRFQNMDGFKTG